MLVAVRVEPRLINILDFKVSLIMEMALAFCRIDGCKPGPCTPKWVPLNKNKNVMLKSCLES
jgi:hypothetical protein